jgi:integrase
MRLVKFRGLWAVYWSEGGRSQRRSLGTADRALAETRFAEFKWQLQRQRAPELVTVGAILNGYIEAMADEKPAKTRNRFILKALLPSFEQLLPHHITAAEIDRHARKRNVAASTLATEIGLIRTALSWAVKAGWITKTPHIPIPNPGAAKDRWLTPDEARRLIDECRAPHIRLFVLLALFTAARKEALLSLTWDRVNNRFIDLEEPGRRQTNKRRAKVPMTKELWNELQLHRIAALTDFVIEFAGREVRSIRTGFEKACKRAGLEDVTPHTLRHTAATWMVQRGVPMAKISHYLGHGSVRTTERIYAHHAPDYLQDAAGAIVLALNENHDKRSHGKRESR